jgi:hypothetical protein
MTAKRFRLRERFEEHVTHRDSEIKRDLKRMHNNLELGYRSVMMAVKFSKLRRRPRLGDGVEKSLV